jgi:hypothetical protein
MKRITFKNPINGFGNALKLIPEGYKIEGHEFVLTDTNETYKIQWSKGKANIITASDKKTVNEDLTRLKQLMNYKSSDVITTVKGDDRIIESNYFSKAIMTEGITGFKGPGFVKDPETGEIKQGSIGNAIDKSLNKQKGEKEDSDEKELDENEENDETMDESKPSDGLTKKEKSDVVKKAKKGEDIGEKGKNFEKVADKAAKEYGSKEAGERVAASSMWKNMKK